MILYVICAAMFGVLFFLSSRMEIETKEEEAEKLRFFEKPFQRMAKLLLSKMPIVSDRKNKRECEKIRLALMVLFLGLTLLPILDFATTKNPEDISDYTLVRPGKGEGSTNYRILAQVEEESELREITIQMNERELSDQEKRNYLKEAEAEIDQIVIGENKSADEVRGRVILPEEVQNGEVSVMWIQDPQGLLDEEGNLIDDIPEEGEILMLTAVMNCAGMESSYEFGLQLYPAVLSEAEKFDRDLRNAVEEAEEDSSQEERIILPKEVDDKKVTWIRPGSAMTGICFLSVILMGVIAYAGKEQEFKNQDENRRRQLVMDYPDIVFRMGMLLNAGLTIQNAFMRIAMEYKEHRALKEKHWAYEEMVAACNEMKGGIAEAKAYENFGRRCGEGCYIRLGTTLSGGIQKSAEGITDILLKEAINAMEDRRQLARKMGEEAGTKLMFPMILMLVVVMVILMVPAMLSM